jgi:hypothetical protein
MRRFVIKAISHRCALTSAVLRRGGSSEEIVSRTDEMQHNLWSWLWRERKLAWPLIEWAAAVLQRTCPNSPKVLRNEARLTEGGVEHCVSSPEARPYPPLRLSGHG